MSMHDHILNLSSKIYIIYIKKKKGKEAPDFITI